MSEIRNAQCGDWRLRKNGSIEVMAVEMKNPDHSFCILLHELIESYLCKRRGITDTEVTKFDKEFEKKRLPGNKDENGDATDCPYAKEHFTATNIERLIAAELGVDWNDYTAKIEALA